MKKWVQLLAELEERKKKEEEGRAAPSSTDEVIAYEQIGYKRK